MKKNMRLTNFHTCQKQLKTCVQRHSLQQTLLIFITIVCFSFYSTAQNNWTGASNSDWNTDANWSLSRVPIATDDVLIPDVVTNDPIIATGTAALAKSVEIPPGGALTISAMASLTINGSKNVAALGTTAGFYNHGTVENNGQLIIGNMASVGTYGLFTRGTINNNAGGEIRIDNSSNTGYYNVLGITNNAGKIVLGANASVGERGLSNEQGNAVFFNNAGGEIVIDNATITGLGSSNPFTNNGKITIGANSSAGFTGLFAQGSFTNNSGGEININRTILNGLLTLNSTFDNYGNITIGETASVGTNGLYNTGTFNNNTGGEISIDRSIDRGLYNQSGIFTNAATLTIGATADVGNYGFVNDATFNNNSGGQIKIDRSIDRGLYNQSGIFTNAATLTIGATADVGNYGFVNEATFNNNAGGQIKIDNALITGMRNKSGTFTNAAMVAIGSSTIAGKYGIENNSTFNNNTNGVITIDRVTDFNPIMNGTGAMFTNSARIAIAATAGGGEYGIYNFGTFNNNSGGLLTIDRSSTFGLNNLGPFNNTGTLTIGTIASVGAYCISNSSTINNIGGEIKLDNSTNSGLNNEGTFNNSAALTIGANISTGSKGIFSRGSINNNPGGTIQINRSSYAAIDNFGGTFTNSANINIGSLGSVGTYGISNYAVFNNSTCSALINIISDNTIFNYTGQTFSNAGSIIENASGNSNISSNTGIVQNLNGGTFIVASGNPSITFSGQVSACCPSGNILYVNTAGAGSVDGTSWSTAYKTLQEALNRTTTCTGITQIWVAKGTYFPDEGGASVDNDRNASFRMKNNLAIYGGFSGTETSLSQRNWKANETILSGEIQQDNNISNNSLHIVNNSYTNAARLYNSAVLDGFTVTGGNADDGASLNGYGGGMFNYYASPTIANCIFSGNRGINGGGFASYYSYDNLSMVNCSFLNNSADAGGGLYLFQTSASNGVLFLRKIAVSSNNAGTYGGGVRIVDAQVGLENSVVSNNSASSGGGGILSSGSSVSLFNSTVYGNTTSSSLYPGGLYFGIDYPGTRLTITNSIFWGNRKAGNVISSISYGGSESELYNFATYSDIERLSGVYVGTGNINQDPLFVSAADPDGGDNVFGTADDGLALQAGSPAKNTGTNTDAPNTDITGVTRPLTVADPADMGAYENTTPPGPTASMLGVNGTSTICRGTTANLVVTITGGTSPYSVVYTVGTNKFTVNNYVSGADIPVSPTITTPYSLFSVTDAGSNIGTGNSGTPTITVTDPPTWYLDADGDGYYVSSTQSCTNPGAGYSTTGLPGDCNDDPNAGGAAINPGANETCDGIDNNCNDQTDEGFTNTDGDLIADCVDPDDDNDGALDADDCAPLDATKWRTGSFFIDGDGDGYGTGSSVPLCYGATTPLGYSTVGGDCKDDNSAINPAATELCDGLDNNCNGSIDEGFINTDGDLMANCIDPDDDNDGALDGVDCAPLDASKWRTGSFYVDGDGDGYGSGSAVSLCYGATTPVGYSTVGGDCKDDNVNIHAPQTYYQDTDGDTYGSSTTTSVCSLTPPTGYVTRSGDCNDNNASINPGAVEVCGNNIDDNCNGRIDEQPCSPCKNATNFTTTNITATSATLSWTAIANPVQWQARYKTTNIGSKWIDVLRTGNIRSVVISSLLANQNYNWQIRAKCGNIWTAYSASIPFKTLPVSASFVTTSVAGKQTLALNQIPGELTVQNYPNPFSSVTTICYTLPVETQVNLDVYNQLGQKVALLVNAKQPAGKHQVNFNASKWGAGIYQYRLQAAEKNGKINSLSGKMVMIK